MQKGLLTGAKPYRLPLNTSGVLLISSSCCLVAMWKKSGERTPNSRESALKRALLFSCAVLAASSVQGTHPGGSTSSTRASYTWHSQTPVLVKLRTGHLPQVLAKALVKLRGTISQGPDRGSALCVAKRDRGSSGWRRKVGQHSGLSQVRMTSGGWDTTTVVFGKALSDSCAFQCRCAKVETSRAHL